MWGRYNRMDYHYFIHTTLLLANLLVALANKDG